MKHLKTYEKAASRKHNPDDVVVLSKQERDEINSIFTNLRDELGSSSEALSVKFLSSKEKDFIKIEFPESSIAAQQTHAGYPIGENVDIFEVIMEIKEAKERLEEIGFTNRYFHVDSRQSNFTSGEKVGMSFILSMTRPKTI